MTCGSEEFMRQLVPSCVSHRRRRQLRASSVASWNVVASRYCRIANFFESIKTMHRSNSTSTLATHNVYSSLWTPLHWTNWGSSDQMRSCQIRAAALSKWRYPHEWRFWRCQDSLKSNQLRHRWAQTSQNKVSCRQAPAYETHWSTLLSYSRAVCSKRTPFRSGKPVPGTAGCLRCCCLETGRHCPVISQRHGLQSEGDLKTWNCQHLHWLFSPSFQW